MFFCTLQILLNVKARADFVALKSELCWKKNFKANK